MRRGESGSFDADVRRAPAITLSRWAVGLEKRISDRDSLGEALPVPGSASAVGDRLSPKYIARPRRDRIGIIITIHRGSQVRDLTLGS